MRSHCPRCNLALERGEEGYQVGSYMFNLIAAELLFAAVFLSVLLLTWPTPPWNALLYGGMALMIIAAALMVGAVGVNVFGAVMLMILAPFLFFPFAKTLFLAFDLVFRPHSHDVPADARRETEA